MTVIPFKTPVRNTLNSRDLEVFDILASESRNVRNMAEMFDCSEQTIRNIKMLRTKRAKRVFVLMDAGGFRCSTWEPAKRFSDAQIGHIRKSKDTSVKLAKQFDCSASTIRMIKTGKTYV